MPTTTPFIISFSLENDPQYQIIDAKRVGLEQLTVLVYLIREKKTWFSVPQKDSSFV
jgi:hypothetical protein